VIFLNLSLMVLTVALGIPMGVLIAELLAAWWPSRRHEHGPSGSADASGNVALLIPAHNEAAGIGPVLDNLRSQMRTGDRLLVVADNCTDATAERARQHGAEVVERQDTVRRGKGYALDHGMQQLRANPPAQVVIVDADCMLAPDALAALRSACARGGAAMQSLYLMRNDDDVGLKQRVSAFAWLIKNHVRPRGARALGWPCPLMGTGMAFPWPQIAQAQLASGNLVEDMQLGIDLAKAGQPPAFCEAALVTSQFPAEAAAAQTQRTRWEHGHMATLLHEAPRLLGTGLARASWRLVGMALDLAVPPLSLLVALAGLVWLLAVASALAGGWIWPAAVMTGALLTTTLLLAAAWSRWGRQAISGRDFLQIPLYILSKMGIYRRFVTARQKDWVRTERK